MDAGESAERMRPLLVDRASLDVPTETAHRILRSYSKCVWTFADPSFYGVSTRGSGGGRYTPAKVLGSQHLAVAGDALLDRRLGWSFEGRTHGGWNGWSLPAARLSVKEVGLLHPVDTSLALAGIHSEEV